MIKLMKYLKRSAGYIVLIIALLFLQAYCDLSLPNYTSNIINVGIQQNGIEDSVPEKIRKTSMDSLKLFMEEDDAKTVDGFYEEEGDDLVLKDKISKEDREELNDIFGKPMVIVSTLTSDSEESKAALAKMGIPEGTDPLADACRGSGCCEGAGRRKDRQDAGIHHHTGRCFLCSCRI